MNKKMHWEILTKNDILISEHNSSFLKDMNDIKLCYFTDGKNFYGVNNDLTFFVNSKIFDFKISEKIISFFQFKSVKFDLIANEQNLKYNIGINTESDTNICKYTMLIDVNIVQFIAEKLNNKKEVIDRRVLIL